MVELNGIQKFSSYLLNPAKNNHNVFTFSLRSNPQLFGWAISQTSSLPLDYPCPYTGTVSMSIVMSSSACSSSVVSVIVDVERLCHFCTGSRRSWRASRMMSTMWGPSEVTLARKNLWPGLWEVTMGRKGWHVALTITAEILAWFMLTSVEVFSIHCTILSSSRSLLWQALWGLWEGHSPAPQLGATARGSCA